MKADLHISINGALLNRVRNFCLENKIRIGKFIDEAIRAKLEMEKTVNDRQGVSLGYKRIHG